jgi:hypothetical protein
MPDIRKYKSVAVPVPTWEKLLRLAAKNQRSPAQQIAFLVNIANQSPSDSDLRRSYATGGANDAGLRESEWTTAS